jgi:hypothetical protein
MPKSMKVEIDQAGHIHPTEPSAVIPRGQAVLSWPDDAAGLTFQLSERSFAEDWLNPEEDAAWAHLQPAK